MAKNEISAPVFDYSILDKDDAGKLQFFAGEVQRVKKNHVALIIKTGDALSDAQELLAKHGSGVFGKWVEAECGISRSSAYRFMAAFREFGGLSQLGQIEPSALYELAQNPCAKKAALRLADRGHKITHTLAKDLIAKAGSHSNGAAPARAASAKRDAPDDSPENSDVEFEEDDPCPNCHSRSWLEDEEGKVCNECGHPFGEPVDDPDAEASETVDRKNQQDERTKAYKKARAGCGAAVRYVSEYLVGKRQATARDHLDALFKLL